MAGTFAQHRLQAVVVTCRARFGDQQGAGSDAGDGRVHTDVRVVVEGSRSRISVHHPLVDVSVVFDVLALLTQISNLQRHGIGQGVFCRQVPRLHVCGLDVLGVDVIGAANTQRAPGESILG